MNRLLVAMTGLLLLASGCTPTEQEKKECQLEAFDLSACDRSGLSSVTADGIWHVNVSLEDGTETPGALRVAAENGLLFGSPLTERQTEGETFFLASQWQQPGYVPTRFALAGCQAPAPDRIQGELRRCSGGTANLKGRFEAVRVSRQAAEAEASGVSLVRETALPEGVVGMDVFVVNGYAYVAALANGLYVVDVRNPEVVPPTPIKPLRVSSNGDSWHQVWVKGQTLFVASSAEGIIVFDVSNPEAPKRVRAVPLPSVEVWGLYVDGDRLYAMSPSPRAEVLIYDVQTPSAPSLLSRYVVEDSLPEEGESPVGGAVHDNHLYVAHWRYGLAVADVMTPNKPEGRGRYKYDKATSRYVAVGTFGGKTIAFEASEGWGSRVRALDVTDPKNIRELASYGVRPESSVLGLTLVGTKLYVAHSLDGLRVLDVSGLGGAGPYQLPQASWYNSWRETDPGRGRFFLDGLSSVKVPGDGYIYATDTSRGLLIFREQG
jgi:hypothetical protein